MLECSKGHKFQCTTWGLEYKNICFCFLKLSQSSFWRKHGIKLSIAFSYCLTIIIWCLISFWKVCIRIGLRYIIIMDPLCSTFLSCLDDTNFFLGLNGSLLVQKMFILFEKVVFIWSRQHVNCITVEIISLYINFVHFLTLKVPNFNVEHLTTQCFFIVYSNYCGISVVLFIQRTTFLKFTASEKDKGSLTCSTSWHLFSL